MNQLHLFFNIISLLLINIEGLAQTKHLPDTFRYKSIENTPDTMYSINKKIGKNVYQITTYYGFSDDTTLSSSVDTFIVGKLEWCKTYNRQTIPFLSVKDFNAKKITYEYIDREKKDRFYLEYSPIMKFSIDQKNLYLYMVRPMSGQGLVESLEETIYYIVFDFDKGLVYQKRSETKILEGYEKYLQYLKW